MIKAIIFDFDGLMIDTETPWYDAYCKVFEEYGVDLPLELWVKVVGTTFAAFDPIHYLEEQTGKSIDRTIIFAKTKKYHDQLMKEKDLREGVRTYLDEAKQKGLRIGLATSSNRAWIAPYLEKYNLRHYFDHITTSDDVEKVKPDPALYLKTVQGLSVDANHAIAFEDSLNGLIAAKAAGLHCVIVPNQVTQFLPFSNYDLRLTSMEDVSLDHVIRTIESR